MPGDAFLVAQGPADRVRQIESGQIVPEDLVLQTYGRPQLKSARRTLEARSETNAFIWI